MKILGTNFFGHDSSIFLMDTNKKKIFAVSTERLTRIKHDDHDISILLEKLVEDKNFCLKDIDSVAQSREEYSWIQKPHSYSLLKYFRKIIKPKFLKDLIQLNKITIFKKFLVSIFVNPKALLQYYKYKFLLFIFKIKKRNKNEKYLIEESMKNFIKKSLRSVGIDKEAQHYNHHKCHAVSSYYFSSFAYAEDALSFTIDGYGDHIFSSLYKCSKENKIELIAESPAEFVKKGKKMYFCSVPFVYSEFTAALGFIRNSDEGKVEALAALGKIDESLSQELDSIVSFNDNMICLDKNKIDKFYDQEYLKFLINKIGRENFASSIQNWLEKTVVDYLNEISKNYKCDNLCLSGGAAANVIMNMKIFEKTNFKNIFVFPAMGDEGVAAGAAILSALENKQNLSWLKNNEIPYFGFQIYEKDILNSFKLFDEIEYKKIEHVYKHAAKSLSENKIIALVQGKMEYGPRALGNRSILANPYNKKTKDRINSQIKRRPAFQPFCPSILSEERKIFFSESYENKHMTIAFRMKKEFAEKFPSAVHVDNTARPQFVSNKDNPRFYEILREFKNLTGHGILINTSFNLHGRSMVNTPYDAIRDFIDCNLDELYLGDYLVTKKIGSH